MPRSVSVIIVVLLVGFVDVRYCQLILSDAVHPTIATWIVFEVAVILSIATYLATKKHSLVDNIANTVDVIATSIVFATIAYKNGLTSRFSTFDMLCLCGAGAITLFWVSCKRHTAANMATQLLLIVGYLPTIRTLWTSGVNPESFAVWGVVLITAIVSLYPAIRAKNRLAIVYATRAAVSATVVLVLMLRIELWSH
ncbi:MAG: hypothetical protein WC246_03140 [Candidatus Paceibacterota bacterium]|jgi:hypothetical protein